MTVPRVKRIWLGMLSAALLALGVSAAPAAAAVGDPLQVVSGGFEDPCGLAVDIAGNFYVSDYYHHSVDPFKASGSAFDSPLANEDPTNGPCGLGIDSASSVYVNNYHQNVVKFTSSNGTNWGGGSVIDTNHPTGVAVDTRISGNPATTDDVYVDDRTDISVYEPSGAPVELLGKPLLIGGGTLEDGYGLAISRYPLTEGRLYVADASDNTVKVYNPIPESPPVMTIAGPGGQIGPFHSLVDSAIAVDRITGEIYVADSVGSPFTDHPESAIYVFSATGIYLGRLKYNVINSGPVGIAVDNSEGANKGRVYVTSGNTSGGSVYIYPSRSAVSTGLPAVFSLSVARVGSGAGRVTSSTPGVNCASSCEAQLPAGGRTVLTATPDPGSAFTGWSGGPCSGTGTCAVTMSESKSVSASFEALSGAAGAGPGTSPATPAGTSSAPWGAHSQAAGRRRHAKRAHRHHLKRHRVKRHRHRNRGPR